MKKILCIDGGGMRGIIPALVLATIEAITQKPICSLFNLIAGVSSGGVLALGLTSPKSKEWGPRYSAVEMIELYKKLGESVFSKKSTSATLSGGSFADEYYSADVIEHCFNATFSDFRLSHSLTDLFLPSFDVESHEPYVFKSYELESPDFVMSQVARCIIAAPQCFEPSRISSIDGTVTRNLMDGCVFSVNPSLQVLRESMQRYGEKEDIAIISLGTGEPLFANRTDKEALLTTPLEGTPADVDEQVALSCSSQRFTYHRFQVILPNDLFRCTDASPEYLHEIEQRTNYMIAESIGQIEEVCSLLGV